MLTCGGGPHCPEPGVYVFPEATFIPRQFAFIPRQFAFIPDYISGTNLVQASLQGWAPPVTRRTCYVFAQPCLPRHHELASVHASSVSECTEGNWIAALVNLAQSCVAVL